MSHLESSVAIRLRSRSLFLALEIFGREYAACAEKHFHFSWRCCKKRSLQG